jgi:hypothetical protein
MKPSEILEWFAAQAPSFKKVFNVDGERIEVRRKTKSGNFMGWNVVYPDGKKYFSAWLTPEEALEAAKKQRAKEK